MVVDRGWRAPAGSSELPTSSAYPYHPAKTSSLELFLNLADNGADLRMATA